MATLDAFFNKIERPVCLSTTGEQKCKSSSENEKNLKDASRKRSRAIDSHSKKSRLKSKRQKPLDTNLNVPDHCTSEVDGAPEVTSNCQSCSQDEVCNGNMISDKPSSTIEISYEDFLTSTGIVHIDYSLDNSEDADSDMIIEVEPSPDKTLLKHSDLESEPLVQSPKKNENSADDDEHEENALSNNSEVASKDIRCFFSKAEKASPQPVCAATFVKVKADVHCQQSQKRSTSSKCIEGHMKTGSDLARRQRASIVITDDDLDIEVIGVSNNDEDYQIDFSLEDNAVSNITPESSTENHAVDAPLQCTEVMVNIDDSKKSDSVSMDTVTPVGKSVVSTRKLRLTVTKLEEANDKADTDNLEKAVVPSQNIISDGDVLHQDKDERSDESDEVIMVDENSDRIDCDSSSADEPSRAEVADGQHSLTLATKSRKPKQVRRLANCCV